MKAVAWSPEGLIVRSEEARSTAVGLAQVVRQGESIVVRIQGSEAERILGAKHEENISMAQFRQGCVTSVEASIRSLPERSRILAEIHRRLDCEVNQDDRSASWRSRLVSVFDFAGAWALAAHLMREGLSVDVIEKPRNAWRVERDEERADVKIILPIGPATQCV